MDWWYRLKDYIRGCSIFGTRKSSVDLLLEKWERDARISNDGFEYNLSIIHF